MNSHPNMDELLRRTLGRYSAPTPSATLTDDIVRRVVSYERVRRQRARFGRYVLLAFNWVAVALGSWWIVRSLPLGGWTPEPLSTAVTWMIPCIGVLLVWCWPILRWLATACRHLLSLPLTMIPQSDHRRTS